MRISQDSSTWKAGGVVRRDFRAQREPEQEARGSQRRKDTLRYCLGNQNHPHDFPEARLPDFDFRFRQRVDVACRRCGKVVAMERRGQIYHEDITQDQKLMHEFPFAPNDGRPVKLYIFEGEPRIKRSHSSALRRLQLLRATQAPPSDS